MGGKTLIIPVLFCILMISLTQEESQNSSPASKRKIVGFKEGLTLSDSTSVIESHGLTIKKYLPLANACLCESGQKKASFHALSQNQSVAFVEDDYKCTVQVLPSPQKPYEILSLQHIPWGIQKINAPEVWKYTRGQGIKVGVIDTGIDSRHPDLKQNIRETHDVLNGKNIDDNGHGTHVAGTIAAADNQIGVIGVAPNVQLYSVKAFDKKGNGQVSDIIEALDWCVKKRVDVINMSFGLNEESQAFHRAIKQVYRRDIVMVAAAGNSGRSDSVMYPARYSEVIAVTALNKSNKVAEFSSSGPEVDVIAPGVEIESTFNSSNYKRLSGTSMAAPHVTGTVALILSIAKVSPESVKLIISSTAEDMGLPKEKQGDGLLNAKNAVITLQRLKEGLTREKNPDTSNEE
jgi:subtilisin family serine protease